MQVRMRVLVRVRVRVRVRMRVRVHVRVRVRLRVCSRARACARARVRACARARARARKCACVHACACARVNSDSLIGRTRLQTTRSEIYDLLHRLRQHRAVLQTSRNKNCTTLSNSCFIIITTLKYSKHCISLVD